MKVRVRVRVGLVEVRSKPLAPPTRSHAYSACATASKPNVISSLPTCVDAYMYVTSC